MKMSIWVSSAGAMRGLVHALCAAETVCSQKGGRRFSLVNCKRLSTSNQIAMLSFQVLSEPQPVLTNCRHASVLAIEGHRLVCVHGLMVLQQANSNSSVALESGRQRAFPAFETIMRDVRHNDNTGGPSRAAATNRHMRLLAHKGHAKTYLWCSSCAIVFR